MGSARDPWQPVCLLEQLEEGRGAAALVHGQAVALFRLDDDVVHAVGNHDPLARTTPLAVGIVGRQGAVPFVASTTHRHAFDLRTGLCLQDPHVRVAVFEVRVEDGVVLVGPRRRDRVA